MTELTDKEKAALLQQWAQKLKLNYWSASIPNPGASNSVCVLENVASVPEWSGLKAIGALNKSNAWRKAMDLSSNQRMKLCLMTMTMQSCLFRHGIRREKSPMVGDGTRVSKRFTTSGSGNDASRAAQNFI